MVHECHEYLVFSQAQTTACSAAVASLYSGLLAQAGVSAPEEEKVPLDAVCQWMKQQVLVLEGTVSHAMCGKLRDWIGHIGQWTDSSSASLEAHSWPASKFAMTDPDCDAILELYAEAENHRSQLERQEARASQIRLNRHMQEQELLQRERRLASRWRKENKLQTSRFRGVSWNTAKQQWQSLIYWGGHREFLGYFDDEEEAAHTYDKAALKHHGPCPITTPSRLSTAHLLPHRPRFAP